MIGRRALLTGALAALAAPARAQAVRPLVRRFERLAALPWLDLGGRPTPLGEAPRLAAELGLGSLVIKHDGLAGHTYGGSKARKLELWLGDARRRGHSSVLTFGGVGSNHALATAVACRRLGLRCHLGLLHAPPGPHARAHMLAALAQGAQLHAATRAHVETPASLTPGERPYVIPMGGTGALGNVGTVDAALELVGQRFDALVVAVGTTGTAVGLYAGLRAAGIDASVIGVRASGRGTANRRRLAAEVRATVSALRALEPRFADVRLDESFVLDDAAVGAGYGQPTRAGEAARRLAARLDGPALDSTYTAKAFSALVRRAPALRGQRVLFWSTWDPREVSHEGARVRDLPRRLRGYARE